MLRMSKSLELGESVRVFVTKSIRQTVSRILIRLFHVFFQDVLKMIRIGDARREAMVPESVANREIG